MDTFRLFQVSLTALVFIAFSACSGGNDELTEPCRQANVLFFSPPFNVGNLEQGVYVVDSDNRSSPNNGLLGFVSDPADSDGRLPFSITAKQPLVFCKLSTLPTETGSNRPVARDENLKPRQLKAGERLEFHLKPSQALDAIGAAFYFDQAKPGPGADSIILGPP